MADPSLILSGASALHALAESKERAGRQGVAANALLIRATLRLRFGHLLSAHSGQIAASTSLWVSGIGPCKHPAVGANAEAAWPSA